VGAELFYGDGYDEANSRSSQFCESALKKKPVTSDGTDTQLAQFSSQLLFILMFSYRKFQNGIKGEIVKFLSCALNFSFAEIEEQ